MRAGVQEGRGAQQPRAPPAPPAWGGAGCSPECTPRALAVFRGQLFLSPAGRSPGKIWAAHPEVLEPESVLPGTLQSLLVNTASAPTPTSTAP